MVVAIGSCPASCNVFAGSPTVDGPLDRHLPVDVYVPGCPPRPDAIIDGIAEAARILAERAGKGAPAEPRRSRPPPGASKPHDLSTALCRLLVFPGLLYAVPAAWLMLWMERKAVARLQQRIGPPSCSRSSTS